MEPGRRIGGWEVVRELARGGQGLVLEVRDQQGRRGALKLLLQSWDDPRDLERLAREARLLAALPPHPGLPRLLDHGQEGGRPFVVLELVVGSSLHQLISTKGPLDAPQAVAFLLEATQAVAHLHAHQVLHRDLKPANMLLEAQTGRVVVVDLGLARRDEGGSLARLTRTGELLGTPAYMAPEQISPGDEYGEPGPRTDVYGLGATLFHLLSGRPPLRGVTPLQLFQARLRAEPPRLLTLRPELSPALDALCARCLAADPAQRPSSARALIAELEQVDRPAPVAPRRRARVVAGAAAALGAAALVGLGLRPERAEERREAEPSTRASAAAGPADGAQAWEERVKALTREGRLDEALELAEQGVERWPARAEAWFGRAVVRGTRGDVGGAREDLDRALALDPLHSRALSNRAVARYALGDQQGAREDFQRAVELDPSNAGAWAALGKLTPRTELKQARDYFERALALDPDQPGALVGRGMVRLAEGDASGAAADAARALRRLPGDVDARLLRARALRALSGDAGAAREGLALLEGLIAEQPDQDAAWDELMSWRAQRLELADALRTAARWRERPPNDLQAWRWTARIALLTEDDRLAGEAAARLLGADPDDLTGLYTRGALRRRQRDLPGALADLGLVLEREPDHPVALLERALARLSSFDHAGSLADADRVLSLPRTPGLAHARASAEVVQGQALFRLGRPGAEEAFQRAIEADPDLLEGWLFRAGMRVELDTNLDGARADVREARRRLRAGARLTFANRELLDQLEHALGPE